MTRDIGAENVTWENTNGNGLNVAQSFTVYISDEAGDSRIATGLQDTGTSYLRDLRDEGGRRTSPPASGFSSTMAASAISATTTSSPPSPTVASVGSTIAMPSRQRFRARPRRPMAWEVP